MIDKLKGNLIVKVVPIFTFDSTIIEDGFEYQYCIEATKCLYRSSDFSTLQFYEFNFDIRKLKKPEIYFFEYETALKDSDEVNWKIHFLKKDENIEYYIDRQTDKIFVNPITDTPVSDQSDVFYLSYEKSLDAYIDKWVPIPFFKTADKILSPCEFKLVVVSG